MRWDLQEHLFEWAIAASICAHALFFGSVSLWSRWAVAHVPPVEVDLTLNLAPRAPWDLRMPGASRGAPAPAPKPRPGPALKIAPAVPQVQAIPAPVAPAPPQKPKEWILPGPQTQTLEKPTPAPPVAVQAQPGGMPGGAGTGGENGQGGSGGGTGAGGAIGNRGPHLINASEIGELLRSSYPPPERTAGHEARVAVAISISDQGNVTGVDVLQSAGALFDAAAKNVAMRMRFEPALVRSIPTAVKVRQIIEFKLTDG